MPTTTTKKRQRAQTPRGQRRASTSPTRPDPVRVFRSLDEVPLICTIDDICAIYRRAKSTVLRDLRNDGFSPTPFAARPYYWHKADIERDLHLKSATAHQQQRRAAAEHRT